MAANDILLKREETISYYDDKMLNPYREFERYVGTFQEFQDQFEPVWYSNYEPYAITNTDYPDGEEDGEGVFKYQLGSSSAITPLRNKLIPSKDYIKEKNYIIFLLFSQAYYHIVFKYRILIMVQL